MPLVPARAALALALLALALGACAAPRAGGFRLGGTATRAAIPGARAQFAPAEGEAVFERAVRAAALEGYRVDRCDADARRLETARLELDAPCGATTCLARQTIQVALGYRQARVVIVREVYDGAARTWRRDGGAASADAERALLERIVSTAGAAPRGEGCAAAARLEVSALGPAPE
jgi:hypothetical protein